MVELPIWYGAGALLVLVGAVAFVAFAVFRRDLGSPYYSLPPLLATVGAVSYAVLALVVMNEMTAVSAAVVRYVGLFLTLPVAIYYLGLLGGADAERHVTAVSVTMVVVVTAYLTTSTTGGVRLGLAALSGTMLLALVWGLLTRLTPADTESSLFLSLRDLTVVALVAYAALYALGPAGLGYLVAADFGVVHLAVDAAFWLAFLVLVLTRTYEVEAASRGAPTPG
jgi:bacteriorhodopsin